MARYAAAAAVLLAVSIYATAAGATVGPLTAVLQETDAAGSEETSSLLPVHRDSHEVEEEEGIKAGRPWGATAGDAASLASAADEEGKEARSAWDKPKKVDDDDRSDSDSDSDEDSDSDSDDDEGHNSKQGSKKRQAPGRKGAPGVKHDDGLPRMAVKV